MIQARLGLIGALAAVVLAAACGRAMTPAIAAADYEVWVVDQSDTRGLKHGGTLYVYAGSDLEGADPSSARPAVIVDLGGEASALCRERTGADPVRPHMVLFNHEHTHATLAFVASGHVVMFDAATRRPIDCLRTSETPTGRQAHAAFPAPDGSYVLVANQNGKRLERIDADFANNRFTHNDEATLDLATCTTPGGAPCQAPGVRPDNAPICPVISEASDLAFVTLRGGGMLVVDPRPTPMRIVSEYDMSAVKGNGCGGVEVRGRMYVNSGGRPGPMEHLHLYGFDVYRFDLDAFRQTDGPFAPNQPEATVVFATEGEHDSHGMVATGGGDYLWVMDRHADVVEVIATADDRQVRTIALNGTLTDNAAPDLTDISPAGDRVFVAFRGPTPLSGDPHIATGSTPGLAVLEVTGDGSDGRLVGLIRLTNVGEDGVERADPHGLRVRRLD
jgi:hypothetical protein